MTSNNTPSVDSERAAKWRDLIEWPHQIAERAMALADEEQAHLRDDLAQRRAELDVDRMHAENPDGCPVCTHMELEQVIATSDAYLARAEAAEAKVRAVEAMARKWESDETFREYELDIEAGIDWTPRYYFAPQLRIALSAEGGAE